MERNLKNTKGAKNDELDLSSNIWTIIFFGIASAFLIATGFFWSKFILSGLTFNPQDYILPTLSIIGFAIFFVTSASLANSRLFGFTIIAMSTFASLAFLPVWLGTFVTSAVISLLLFHSLKRTKDEYSNSINFKATDVAKAGMSGIFTAISLLLAFYYLYTQLNQPIEIIPRGVIESAVSISEEIFGEQIENTLSSKIAEDIGNTIENKIDKIIYPYKKYIPYVFAFFFFISVRGLLSFLKFLIIPLFLLVIKILLATKVIRMQEENMEVKRLSF